MLDWTGSRVRGGSDVSSLSTPLRPLLQGKAEGERAFTVGWSRMV